MHRSAPVVLSALLAFVTCGVAEARTPPTPCAGRFAIIPPDAALLGDGGPAATWLEVAESGEVTIDACGPTAGRVRAKRHATAVHARWTSCGAAAQVALSARIRSPACAALAGAVKRKGAKRVRFDATRVACGDGRRDAGEACDASAPAGDGACPGACVACACTVTTTSTTTTTSTSTSTVPADGPPIVAPLGTWTWVDVPDAVCDDGSPTGIAVNLADSPNVIMLLGFGGLCWDATTCWVENTAVHGPIGAQQFEDALNAFSGDILDRSVAGNPFATWNLVAVPYCTGDLHAGDNVVVYDTGTSIHIHHHAGHANLLAYLRRLGPTFPAPGKVVLGGISAGGFGALLDFPTVRARWPAAQAYALDDSGPFIESASFDSGFVANWFTNWRLDLVTDPVCDGPCRSDLSRFLPALAADHPTDRIALISSVQDEAIRNIFQLTAPEFETALLDMTADRIEPTANVRYFYLAGETHAQLLDPATVSQNNVYLLDWLTQFVGDDPAWTSVQP